jgi:membrane dipeptidase
MGEDHTMLIIDAHLDLSMNAIQWNRDLLLSAYTIRTQEQRTAGKGRAQGTVAFPEMRTGRIALSVATLIARSTVRPAPHIDYHSPTQAYGMANGQLAYYRALEMEGHIRIISDLAALDSHMAEWEAWDQAHPEPLPLEQHLSTPPLGFVISMEGADPILHPEQLAACGRLACACLDQPTMGLAGMPVAPPRNWD